MDPLVEEVELLDCWKQYAYVRLPDGQESTLVEEVELLEANPQYAYVRLPDGQESTVSLHHLTPAGSSRVEVDLHCNDLTDQESPSDVTT
ncbi:hypothetical protein M513_12734 [Trichuris suis]|uniref:Uncharacterized protein n=1 Tax=Trichuris suis TaxID=68888 RepID=A0A085LN53_9BILA|nr:hypothetical protein M513_12734 [Trichuris suis]